MVKKRIEFLKSDQFRELALYIVIGVLTTVISYVSYWAATRLILLIGGFAAVNVAIETAGTVISHIIAIAFAFVTNKKFVFRTGSWRGKQFWHEVWTFTAARLLSLALDVAFMALALGALGMHDMVAKFIVQFVIVAANYFASKFWVFRKGGR